MNRVLFSPVKASLAASSLGFSAALRGLAPCERATLTGADRLGPRSVESHRPLGEFQVVFVSVAWELEMATLVASLQQAGINAFCSDRPDTDPLVIGGGPLTISNPELLASVCDAIFVGEADNRWAQIVSALDTAIDRKDALMKLAAIDGMFVTRYGNQMPTPRAADCDRLPVFSILTDEPNEFSNAFLVEVGRGCPRRCGFCVARKGFRPTHFVPAQRILDVVPASATRVGLMGAAVSDHPQLLEIVDKLEVRGHSVTIGSVRADRVKPAIVSAMVRAGARSLTIGVDGASQAVRDFLKKDVTEDHLLRSAEIARVAQLRRLRLYVMIGVPTETDDDIIEFGRLVREMSKMIQISVSVSPFVPKRYTPLEHAEFGPVSLIKKRLSLLKKTISSTGLVRAGSPRIAKMEWLLSHSSIEESRILLEKQGSTAEWDEDFSRG